MKFLYEYRTRTNELCRGALSAPSRDGAFAALKAKGIRPARLTEAPGFFNHLFGKGKRWLAIGVLGALCLALCALTLSISHQAQSTRDRAQSTLHEAQSTMDVFDSPTRRQLIGDEAVIEKGIATGWADVFAAEGDRFLASFAIPGHAPAVRSTTEAELRRVLDPHSNNPTLPHSNNSPASPSTSSPNPNPNLQPQPSSPDSLEARQIRAIVAGMKRECREFLADGSTFADYGRALVRRQEQEIAYYQRAKRELDVACESKMPRAQFMALWEMRNAQLRRIGVKLVPLPEE